MFNKQYHRVTVATSTTNHNVLQFCEVIDDKAGSVHYKDMNLAIRHINEYNQNLK